METEIIAIYCICDEVVKCFGIQDDKQCKMTTAEILTFSLVSAIYYSADYRKTRLVAKTIGYFKNILSHSRIVRRIHSICSLVWHMIFQALQMILRKGGAEHFVVDSFPVKTYENYKSFRAKIFRNKEFHCYNSSKKQYFFGIKVHMIIDEYGVPIEFCFTPGSEADIVGLQKMSLDLPNGAILMGDKAYTCYEFEDELFRMNGVRLMPKRKKNMKRQHTPLEELIIDRKRSRIETVFSSIVQLMPRYIKARTEAGFYLKVMLFIIGYTMHLACRSTS